MFLTTSFRGCLLALVVFYSIPHGSSNAQPNADPLAILSKCSELMAGPVQYRVKASGTEWLISRNSNGAVRMEFAAPGLTNTYLVVSGECYELLPKANVVIDAAFRRNQIRSLADSFTFDKSQVLNVKDLEDSGTKYLLKVTTAGGDSILAIDKSTGYLLERTAVSLDPAEQSGLIFFDVSNKSIDETVFILPEGVPIQRPADINEYREIKTLAMTIGAKQESGSLKNQPTTPPGSIPPPPEGVSNEEWARMIAEQLGNMDAPENMTQAQLQRLSEAWKENYSLKPVTITDVPTLDQSPSNRSMGYWVGGGVMVLIACVGLVYWLRSRKR